MSDSALPAPIVAELRECLLELQQDGYSVSAARYDAQSFGNWYVDLAGPLPLRIVKDRGQYIVHGNREALETSGLARSFEDLEGLNCTLLASAS